MCAAVATAARASPNGDPHGEIASRQGSSQYAQRVKCARIRSARWSSRAVQPRTVERARPSPRAMRAWAVPGGLGRPYRADHRRLIHPPHQQDPWPQHMCGLACPAAAASRTPPLIRPVGLTQAAPDRPAPRPNTPVQSGQSSSPLTSCRSTACGSGPTISMWCSGANPGSSRLRQETCGRALPLALTRQGWLTTTKGQPSQVALISSDRLSPQHPFPLIQTVA